MRTLNPHLPNLRIDKLRHLVEYEVYIRLGKPFQTVHSTTLVLQQPIFSTNNTLMSRQ